jgi:hypothetical protein
MYKKSPKPFRKHTNIPTTYNTEVNNTPKVTRYYSNQTYQNSKAFFGINLGVGPKNYSTVKSFKPQVNKSKSKYER